MPQEAPPFVLTLYSFGYKYQMPQEKVNFLFDVRSLPNPYWQESLRHLSGIEKVIADYVLESKEGKRLKELLAALLIAAIEQHYAVEKRGFTIAIGCTGGRHRSVAMVEFLQRELYRHFTGSKFGNSFQFHTYHRDLEKDASDRNVFL